MTTDDRLKQLTDVVKKMRAAQKIYFRTRGGIDDCKKLESAVDRLLEQYDFERHATRPLFVK